MSSLLAFAIVCSPINGLHVMRVSKEATPAMLVQLNNLLLSNKLQMKDEPKNPKPLQRILSLVLQSSPHAASTAVVYLRQGQGGITIDILPYTIRSNVPNPPAINPLARRQHQKELFILLSLVLQRIKIVCPEDVIFTILDYLTANVVINGRICALEFDVKPGAPVP